MFKAEKKVCDWIAQHVTALFFIAITALAVYVRIDARKFLSVDTNSFLLPWFYEMKESGGLKALGEQIGDYNLLYQTFIALISYLPVEDNWYHVMYLYKILSCIFDFILAWVVALSISEMGDKGADGKKGFLRHLGDPVFCAAYAIVLFIPTVAINSAFWAQCDAIYSAFLVLCLLYLHKEKYIGAFVFYGIALAFKFQTVFLFPFLLAYYFYKKKFSFLMFVVSVATFWLSGIVAYFNGRSLLAPFSIYFGQTETYEHMYLNTCSFWVLFADDYPRFKTLAIFVAVFLCGLGLYIVIVGKKRMDTPVQVLNTATWFLWVCIFFLPAMHDRYTYLRDILLVMLAFLDKKYVKYAAVCLIMSLTSYATFLTFLNEVDEKDSLIIFFAWVHYTYTIMKQEENQQVRGKEM